MLLIFFEKIEVLDRNYIETVSVVNDKTYIGETDVISRFQSDLNHGQYNHMEKIRKYIQDRGFKHISPESNICHLITTMSNILKRIYLRDC